ncbi:MAG: dTDP-4-dehydrorhamnose 3,5-epimerase family protein [Longimicrobiales bacterium]|nr:dTDP-4-dehydrorhamnose 3,5-epimerase family protein [Longimicrobiales bacterium]
MRFTPTRLAGVFVVDLDRRVDDRGYFARTWCREEIEAQGLDPTVAQINTGFSHLAGTVRGMHFQAPPDAEIKFVRCTRGRVFDVALDLRPDSSTFRQWVGVELGADDGRMLWIPEGCAHGYQTLEPGSELLYTTSRAYAPASAGGVRWDDPAFGIRWPLPVTSISEADATWPDFPRGTEHE